MATFKIKGNWEGVGADSHQQQPFNNWPLNGSDKKQSRKWQLTYLILGALTMYGTLNFFFIFDQEKFYQGPMPFRQKHGKNTTKTVSI